MDVEGKGTHKVWPKLFLVPKQIGYSQTKQKIGSWVAEHPQWIDIKNKEEKAIGHNGDKQGYEHENCRAKGHFVEIFVHWI